MALNLKLQVKLNQQLVMTPQLQQAIKMLQLSRHELEEFIEQALLENPVIEEGSDSEETDDEELPDYITSSTKTIDIRSSRDNDHGLEATLSNITSLEDHLNWQLDTCQLGQLEKNVGRVIIGNINADGYLTTSLREIMDGNPELMQQIEQSTDADWARTADGWPDFDLQSVDLCYKEIRTIDSHNELAEIQPQSSGHRLLERIFGVLHHIRYGFEPAGCGSRSLYECLEVQLKELNHPLALRIVKKHIKLLENKDLHKIARREKVSLEDILDAYRLITALEPKPGRSFNTKVVQYINPDVYVYRYNGNSEVDNLVGDYRVVLNDRGFPGIKLSSFYTNLSPNVPDDKSLTNEYIQEKIKDGQWLLKSIEQRQRTILAVTKSIVKHQHEFFEKGVDCLKPMVLRDVAADIDMHESTVSRTTNNKYLHSPQGIFELKYFFTSGIEQGSGGAISSMRIKGIIDRYIRGEDLREPLTDYQISELLSDNEDIKVARRTVAKYREALNILPSNKRKRLY